MSKNTTLITGIPRSGTSLVLKLIYLDSSNICFSEPTFIKEIKAISKSKKDISDNLNKKIIEIRDCIKGGKPLEFRVGKDDKISDNYFTKACNNTTRKKTSKFKKIILKKKFSQNKIFIKNNLLFTSCIAELSKQYKIIAIIRNPISIIQSWQSLDLPISKGVVKSGLKYSSSLKNISGDEGLLIKQIKIIDWFYNQYLVNKVTLIKYENFIESPKESLNNWIDKKTSLPRLSQKKIEFSNVLEKENLKVIKAYSKLYCEMYFNS
jgi:hypothetical protein